jgi:hypothetical protein
VPALPAGLSYVEVAAGLYHNIARRSDGSLVVWGDDTWVGSGVPALPAGLSYVEVAAGAYHNVARRSDGSVVAWGMNSSGQCNVPSLPAGLTYAEIDAGERHTVARLSDDSVVAWGNNGSGQCNVPALPAGLVYVEVTAGSDHTAARRNDGSAVAWGLTPDVPALPDGLSYVELAGGSFYTAARRSNGSVVAWGANGYGQGNTPSLTAGEIYLEVDAGEHRTAARYGEPPPQSVYCTAKTNSLGCLPSIGASGWPSATAGSGFQVTGVDQLNNKAGFLFYGMNGAAALPFYGGTKCVNPPIKRTLVQDSLGTPAPAADCSGIFAVDMNAFAVGALGGNPDPALSVPGTVVNCQWWSRDAAGNTALSDGLEYAIGL